MSITSSLRWLVASNPEKMRSSKKRQHRRRLNVESLESRLMLAAPEPVSVDPESPLANSHTSPHLANVSLTFDTFGGTLDDTMLDEEFVVHAMQQGRMPSISGDFSVSGDSIIANPGGGFFPGELVQVSATTGIQNTGGETLAQPFTWQFRAAANGGAGVFSNNVPFGNSYSWDVALGDIDGDSDLDAFFADANAPSEVWLNDGVGNFSLQQTLPDFEAIAVALGDLNGNGHLDAFVVGTSSDNVLLNDGSGNLSEDPLPTQDMQSTDVALGDIDGDGDLDALVTSADYGGKVWENDGNGVFSNSQILAGSQSEAVELGDLDGDGDLDAFIVNRAHGTPTSTFWKNDGSGNFTPQQSFGTFNDGDVVLGDVDGDGDLDALVSGDIYGYAEPTLYLNDNGMFTDSGQYVGFNAMSAVLGDLDGDSDLDIFFGNFYQGNTVWINDGNGNFSDNGQYLGEFGVSNAVATGDVDGDGDLDVLVGNADTLYNQIWLNDNAADSDGDGVPDSVEQNNPGGDTSNDPSIASLPNAVDGQYVTLTASSGALENVRAIENPSPADAPDGATFPFGLFEYEIHDLTPGQLVTVTMDLPAGSAVGSFYQFAPQSSGANEEWSSFEYDGTTGADVPSGNQLAIHFQDGARGDSDFMADGIIIDPGGPALLPANTAPTTTGISDVQVAEDAADTAVDLFAAFDDAEDTDVALTYSVESNTNTGLFASTNVAAGTLTLDYAPDANGTADIKVRATDTGGLFVETTFTITVDPVNDAPEITSLSVDQAMIFENESVTLTGNFTDPDAGDEHTVTIDWGDGTVQVETLAIDDRSFSFPHQYLDDNPNVTSQDDYNVRVSVIDDDSACVNPPGDLVSWWRGESNGDDLIGGQTVVAQGSATFGSSQVGQGFEMTAAGDAFHAPDSPIWHLQEFTVDAWVNATEARNSGGGLNTDALGGVVAVKVNNDFPHSGPDYNSWWISYQPLTGQFSTLVGPTTVAYLQSATGFAAGQFHHVAMTYDGQDLKLYVNGTFQGQKSIGQPIQYGSARLGIGGHAFGNFPFDRTLIGTVDEVQIFNGELTLQEISDIYNAGNAGKCATATTQVTVKNVNPVAADQDYTTDEDVQISFNVLVGTDDSGPFTVTDQGTLDTHTAIAGTFPTTQGGSVTIATNGSATYTPAPNFFGTDSFDFNVEDDDTGSGVATVTITVDAVNDAPQITSLTVDEATIFENESVTLEGGFSDPDVVETTLFLEDFEAYAEGSNLTGQGGWTALSDPIKGSTIFIGTGSGLGTKVPDGRQDPGTDKNTFSKNIFAPGGLDSNSVHTLSFDAYAFDATTPQSHNAGVFFHHSTLDNLGAGWGVTQGQPVSSGNEGWTFDVRNLVGDPLAFEAVLPFVGRDQLVQLSVILDPINGETYGIADFGAGGTVETSHFSFTPAQFAEMVGVVIHQDYRSFPSLSGAEFDNIRVTAAAVSNEHTVTIDWGDGTVQVETLAIGDRSFSFPHQYLDDGPSPGNGTSQDSYAIDVTVTDDDGGVGTVATGTGGLELDFALSLGSTGPFWEFTNDVITDGAGDIYVAGNFTNTVDFDPGPGTFNLTGAGLAEPFVAKYTSNGDLIWAKEFNSGGHSHANSANSLALDSLGNLYVGGVFHGTMDSDPGPGVVNLNTVSSLGAGFLIKLNSAGDFVWSHQLALHSHIKSVAVDAADNLFYAFSAHRSAVIDVDPGAGVVNVTAPPGTGPARSYVVKVNSVGNFEWVQGIGGYPGEGSMHQPYFAVDSSGNVLVASSYTGTIDFDAGGGTTNLTSVGGTDVAVWKLDSVGNLVWAKSMGGTSNDNGFHIALDSSGNVYTVGKFEGTADFDPGAATSNLTSVGSADGFVSKLDSSGNFAWAKSFGSSAYDALNGVTVDQADRVLATGLLQQTADLDPGPGVFNLSSNGGTDIAVWRLDSNGGFLDAVSTGGTGSDEGAKIAVDSSGDVLVGGWFNGLVDFDPTAGTSNLTSNGGNDGLLWKLATTSLGPAVTVKNVDPVAADQDYTMNEDDLLNINVLAGTDDSGPFTVTDQGTLDTHTAVAGTFPTAQGGSVTIAPNGNATYTPAANFFGIDTFAFTVEDDDTGSDIGNVTITVDAVNDEPDVVFPSGNSALTFDGSNPSDKVEVGTPLPLSGQSFSWEFRVNRATNLNTGDSHIVFGEDAFYGVGNTLHVGYRAQADSNGDFTFAFFDDDLNYFDPGGPAADIGTFVHWAGTYNVLTGHRTLYKNGALVAQDNSANVYGGPGNLVIGTDLHGDTDFVRIWSGLRTPTQIAESAAGQKPDYSSALLAYEFNEASSVVAIDSSPNNNDGTITGATRTVLTPAPDTTNEDVPLTISGVTVSDIDAGSDPIAMSLTVNDGALSLTNTTGLTFSDADGSDGTLAFTGSQTDITAAFAASIVYTPDQDFNGSDTLTITANDQGNNGSGGPQQDSEQLSITVNAVNDEPSFTATDPPAVDQDLGPQTVVSWAAFDPGPANESGQTATYSVVFVGTPSLFVNAPAIAANGTLTYESAASAFGTSTFDVQVQDNGGIANGGDDTSTVQTFTITINQTNTPPTTTGISNVQVGEDASDTIVDLFAAFDDQQDADADMTYVVHLNTNPGLFTSTTIDGVAGELTLDYAADTSGTADITVLVTDTGGLTVDATFTVTVLTAEEQIDEMVATVENLNDTGVLNNGQANPPLNFLGQALKDLDKGKITKAVQKLNDFIDRIQDLIDDGTLTPAEGQPLIDIANAAIQSALPGSPLLAASAAPSRVPAKALTSAQLDLVVGQARSYWHKNGANRADMARLSQVPIYVANLPGRYLGAASADAVWIDQDASGHGWSVDHRSPGRMDLLSAVTHEFGHALGFEHDEASVMQATLDVAFRRDAVASYGGPLQSEFFRNLEARIDSRTCGVEIPHGRDEAVRFGILDEAVRSIASGWPFSTSESPIASPRRLSAAAESTALEDEDELTVDRELLAADNVDSVFETF